MTLKISWIFNQSTTDLLNASSTSQKIFLFLDFNYYEINNINATLVLMAKWYRCLFKGRPAATAIYNSLIQFMKQPNGKPAGAQLQNQQL